MRLVFLLVLMLVGVALYFTLGRGTDPVIAPASVQETP